MITNSVKWHKSINAGSRGGGAFQMLTFPSASTCKWKGPISQILMAFVDFKVIFKVRKVQFGMSRYIFRPISRTVHAVANVCMKHIVSDVSVDLVIFDLGLP